MVSSSEPSSLVSSSSSKPQEPRVSDLTEADYGLFVGHYLRKMASFSSYKAITKGSTVAKVLFIETTQSIDVTLIKSDYSYLKNESHSSLVNTVHECYFHGKETLYRDEDNGEFSKKTLNEYLDVYGVYPFDQAVEGYDVLSEGCVKSTEKIGVEEGVHTFKLTLDVEKSSNNVRIQMKQFGGLDDYPVFSSIAISVSVEEDYTPKAIQLVSEYKAKKFMESDCRQEYTVTFSSLNETIDVPQLREVREKYSF